VIPIEPAVAGTVAQTLGRPLDVVVGGIALPPHE
jgi:hypothetical protein